MAMVVLALSGLSAADEQGNRRTIGVD